MKTILHQGRPKEGGDWLALPEHCVGTYKELGYGLRELVLRDDAEQAKVEHFNAAIELAITLVVTEFGEVAAAVAVNKLRGLKLKPVKVKS